jgi:HEAT repeat protein
LPTFGELHQNAEDLENSWRPNRAAENLIDARASSSASTETATLSRKALVFNRSSAWTAPLEKGASARCCSVAPRCGGPLSSAGFGAPFFYEGPIMFCNTATTTKTRTTNAPKTVNANRLYWVYLSAVGLLIVLSITGSVLAQPAQPKTPDEETSKQIAALIKASKSQILDDRLRAIESLGEMGQKATSASRDLCALLLDPEQKIQVTSIDALKKVNPKLHNVVNPIFTRPTGVNHMTTLLAMRAMGAAAKPATPVLIWFKELHAKKPNFPGDEIVLTLARVAPDDLVVTKKFTLWIQNDANKKTRIAIAKALPTMTEGKSAAPTVASILKSSKTADIKVACAQALGELGRNTPGIIEALTEAKTDSDAAVREAARIAIGRVQANPQEKEPANAKVDPVPAPAQDKATQDQIDALVKFLKDKQPATRLKAIEGLGELGTKAKTATSFLVGSLFDPVPNIRFAANVALRKVNPSLHAPVMKLIEPVGTQDGLVDREKAIFKIAKMGADGKAALPALIYYQQQVSNRGFGNKDQLAASHTKIVAFAMASVAADDSMVANMLVTWMHQHYSGDTRGYIASVLPDMANGKNAVGALAQSLRADPDFNVREAAAKALGKLGADAKAAVPALMAAESDGVIAVQNAARAALKRVQEK